MAASLETNKVLAALLTAGVIASASGVISRIIYQPSMPEENAYVIQVAEGEAGGGEAAEAETPPLPVLLAAASPEEGESEARPCVACHSFDKGGAAKIGPPLWDVVGRDIASVEGFAYSDALLSKEGEWTFEELDAFIHDPKGYAPGTKMTFAGIKDPEDLADVLVYLRSLSDQPVPLPEPPPAQQAEEQPAEGAGSQAAAEGTQEAGGAGQPAAEATQQGGGAEAQPAAEGAQQGEAQPATEVAEQASGSGAQPAAGGAQQPAAQPAAQETEHAARAAAPPAAGAEASAEQAPDPDELVAAVREATPEQAAAPAAADGGVGTRLAHADLEAGAKAARKCAACHSFEEGGQAKIGPPLWGVVGRDIASIDFPYSSALAGKEGAWDYQSLDAFLAEPREWAPGTKMAFAGIRKPEERADVILYLRSLSNQPAPLP